MSIDILVNQSLPPYAMGGFNTQLKESLLRTSPGGNHIGAVLMERSRIEALAELRSGAQILEQMEVNNSARLTPHAHRREGEQTR